MFILIACDHFCSTNCETKYQLTPLPEASHVTMSKPSWEVLFFMIDAASREEHLVGEMRGMLKLLPPLPFSAMEADAKMIGRR